MHTVLHGVDAVLNRSPGPEPGDDMEQGILNGMHVLVAQDNEINAEILSTLLDMAGATCSICENGPGGGGSIFRFAILSAQQP